MKFINKIKEFFSKKNTITPGIIYFDKKNNFTFSYDESLNTLVLGYDSNIIVIGLNLKNIDKEIKNDYLEDEDLVQDNYLNSLITSELYDLIEYFEEKEKYEYCDYIQKVIDKRVNEDQTSNI